MEWLTDPQVWLALVTLSALEIVLGIDILFSSPFRPANCRLSNRREPDLSGVISALSPVMLVASWPQGGPHD